MISRHPNTHSQFWRNHCLELRCLATNVSLILFRLSLERVADNVMIEQGMFYRTRETLQSPRPINNLVIWKQSLSIAVLKCRAFRPSFPKTPHTPPVTGAWRRWSPKPLLHYSIQSFISSISILIFCTVVCYGIRSPLVGSPRFGQDGATPWQPGSVLVTNITWTKSWLQIDKNGSR